MTTQIEHIEWHSAENPPKTDGVHSVPILAQSADRQYKSTSYMSVLKHGEPTREWFYAWSEYDADNYCYKQKEVIAWAERPKGWQETK